MTSGRQSSVVNKESFRLMTTADIDRQRGSQMQSQGAVSRCTKTGDQENPRLLYVPLTSEFVDSVDVFWLGF
jgi:hypothetical protein